MTLSFDRTSVPHHNEIANVLINASSIGFDIEGSSSSVDGKGFYQIIQRLQTCLIHLCPIHFFLLVYSFKWSQPQAQYHHFILPGNVVMATRRSQVNRRKSEVCIFEKENIFVNSFRKC